MVNCCGCICRVSVNEIGCDFDSVTIICYLLDGL